MSKCDDYKIFAASSLELAHKTDNPADKARLLGMAEAWLDLSDRLNRLLKSPSRTAREDPAIRATFRGNRLEAD
jgi:hypothetical protein